VQAFVHPAATRLWVDATDLDLVAVLAADPDAEREPAGRELRDRGELPGDRNRVAQRQQIEPHVHRQVVLDGEQGGRRYQPIRARSDEEAHMVPHADVIDALIGDVSERRRHPVRTVAFLTDRRKQPHPDAARDTLVLSHRPRCADCRCRLSGASCHGR
jgi:hypothetical protein